MSETVSALEQRIVGWITLQIGSWYMRKRARELAPKVAAGAAVAAGALVVLAAWETQRRRG